MKKALAHISAPRLIRTGFPLRARLLGALVLMGLLAGLGLLASRPAHTAGGPIPVSVANTPLAVTMPPGQPVDVVVAASSTTSPATALVYTVPAHKSLVVSSMTLYAGGGHPGPYVGVVDNEDSAGTLVSYATLTAPASTNSDVTAVTQPMHFTVGPGGKVVANVNLRDPSGVFALVSLSGNLIDTP